VAFLVVEETLMRSILSWTAALAIITASTLAHAAAPPALDAARVAALLEKLDHDRYNVRERADRELRKLGKPVLGRLRAEMERTPSVEVRRRLRRMIHDLTVDERIPGLVKELGRRETQFQQMAAWELRRYGKSIVPLLKKQLKPSLSAEHRQRVEALITELSASDRR
jgi:hypothetical protein